MNLVGDLGPCLVTLGLTSSLSGRDHTIRNHANNKRASFRSSRPILLERFSSKSTTVYDSFQRASGVAVACCWLLVLVGVGVAVDGRKTARHAHHHPIVSCRPTCNERQRRVRCKIINQRFFLYTAVSYIRCTSKAVYRVGNVHVRVRLT